MDGRDIAIIATVLVGYAAVSGRLRGTPITAAMVFVAVGYVLGSEVLGVFETGFGSEGVKTLAEATLALVLFSDASDLDTRALTRESSLPLRLLGIGLPLTILAGTVLAIPFFPELGIFDVLVLAVLLAPTDAALGQAVVSDRRLPTPVRQGLNVESGLNDGICVPLLFGALAMAQLDQRPTFDGEILTDLVTELAVATAVGAMVAVVTASLASYTTRRDWMAGQWLQVIAPASAAIAYVVTTELGGSGFIACFVAGLFYGRLLGSRAHETTVFSEELGQILNAATFVMFGSVVIGAAITDLDAATVIYSLLSLTVVRMIPVAVALIGSRAAAPTVLFTGWFGPRGLATIVFMLTILDESGLTGTARIVQVATLTVLLSVFAHGITASPLTARYATWFAARRDRLVMESVDADAVLNPNRHTRHLTGDSSGT